MKRQRSALAYQRLAQRLFDAADTLLATPAAETQSPGPSQAMLEEPPGLMRWWDGAFEQSPSEQRLLAAAARAYAAGNPLPPLTTPQRGRLALRLRLGARWLRALALRGAARPRGALARRLEGLSERQLVAWVLGEGWAFAAELFDETLCWADSVSPPLAPSYRPPPPPPAGASWSECFLSF